MEGLPSFSRSLLVIALFAGCDHDAPSGQVGVDSAATLMDAPGEAALHRPPGKGSPHGNVQPHAIAPCMAATVEGSATTAPLGTPGRPAHLGADGGSALLVAGAAVPDDVWIDLGMASRLTTRDAASTRETTYLGPGRFRVCIAHKEESWVASGVFESIGGAGERPGGEEWVATPLGVARYDVAKLRLTVKEKTVVARVSSGTAYYWPSDGVTTEYVSDAGGPSPSINDQGWVRLDGATGATLKVTKATMTAEGAEAALDPCVQAAADAKNTAARLAEPDANFAENASRHVVARQRARAACGVANLRTESLPPSASREALLERVREAESDYKSIGSTALSPSDL
jgi:hypothetical protein